MDITTGGLNWIVSTVLYAYFFVLAWVCVSTVISWSNSLSFSLSLSLRSVLFMTIVSVQCACVDVCCYSRLLPNVQDSDLGRFNQRKKMNGKNTLTHAYTCAHVIITFMFPIRNCIADMCYRSHLPWNWIVFPSVQKRMIHYFLNDFATVICASWIKPNRRMRFFLLFLFVGAPHTDSATVCVSLKNSFWYCVCLCVRVHVCVA